MGWNIENNGSEPFTIASQLAEFEGHDIVGLCEVSAANKQRYTYAMEIGEGHDYQSILSEQGRGDRLMILFDDDKFELIESMELDEINIMQRVRPALVARFKSLETGQEFFFMVNHLYRTNDDARKTQAELLNDWAKESELPVIAVGDYNFDYEIDDEQGNESFEAFMEDDVFKWLRPVELIRTIWSPGYDPSILDFIFVSGAAKNWQAESRVMVRPFDFPDTEKNSDHRPIEAWIDIPSVAGIDN